MVDTAYTAALIAACAYAYGHAEYPSPFGIGAPSSGFYSPSYCGPEVVSPEDLVKQAQDGLFVWSSLSFLSVRGQTARANRN
jgi:hypothetical protein